MFFESLNISLELELKNSKFFYQRPNSYLEFKKKNTIKNIQRTTKSVAYTLVTSFHDNVTIY